MMRRTPWSSIALLLAAVAAPGGVFKRTAVVLSAQILNASGATEVHVLPLRGNVYVLVGAGANITLSVGREGVLLVDAGTAQMADRVIEAVTQLAKAVTAAPATVKPCAGFGCAGVTFGSFLGTVASPAPPKPIQYVIDTNADADHVGGIL